MNKEMRRPLLLMILPIVIVGCSFKNCLPPVGCDPVDVPNLDSPTYLSIEQACVDDECAPVDTAISPLQIDDYSQVQYQQMTLEQCIEYALQNSKVFRDLGGNILRFPEGVQDVYTAARIYTDPRFSEEAALAAFDTNFVASAFFQNDDSASKARFQGVNGVFQSDANQYELGFEKLAATGTFFALRHAIDYDFNNQVGNNPSSSWDAFLEGEIRQPLLQGSGVLFNRIAGPSQEPGVYNGVLIARTNTEIGLTEFATGVRDLISEVENAYWDLYFAYRNLEAQVDGRNKAWEVYQEASAASGREGTQGEAQAREQYLRFEANVLNAMEGRLTAGTRNNNGVGSGVFQSSGGVRVSERRLRLVVGMPINGAKLIKPTDEPSDASVHFDWDTVTNDALQRRPELSRRRWEIKKRELELIAAKNFLQPRLDLIGQYRFRGTGHHLYGGGVTWNDGLNDPNLIPDTNAYADMFSGDYKEWQVGAELSVPIGYRRAHLGVRNTELNLARERAILREQKREVVFGVSNAMSELRRASFARDAAENRFIAAREFQAAMKVEAARGRDRDIELEAQRRVVESQVQFYQAQVDYVLAIKNLHYEKGTYLEYCNVGLAEGQSDPGTIRSAALRSERRRPALSYISPSLTIGSRTPPSTTNYVETFAPVARSESRQPAADLRSNSTLKSTPGSLPESFIQPQAFLTTSQAAPQTQSQRESFNQPQAFLTTSQSARQPQSLRESFIQPQAFQTTSQSVQQPPSEKESFIRPQAFITTVPDSPAGGATNAPIPIRPATPGADFWAGQPERLELPKIELEQDQNDQ